MIPNPFEQAPIVWRPTPQWLEEANLTGFMRKQDITSLNSLRQRAAQDPAWFWDSVMEDLSWPFTEPYHTTLDLSDGIAWPRFFVGGQTNLALAAVDRHAVGSLADKVAVISHPELGAVKTWTYRQLYDQANQLAAQLLKIGVGLGDIVGVYLPMTGEAVVAMLALAKVGAIFLPVFSGYGADALRIRLEDANAKVLICADGMTRRGKSLPMKAIADQAASELNGQIEHIIVVQKTHQEVPWTLPRDLWWHDLVGGELVPDQTRIVDSETPLMVIYTSGTTGKPKGAVHTHTGFPVKCTQDLQHSFDFKASDILFWFTDMGWMMGPFMVYGGLITGATIVLYDGTPDWPDPQVLWRLLDEHRVTIFGISPTVIRALMVYGTEPLAPYTFDSLRILGSSGEPWNPDPWDWFFTHVGHQRCPIVNYSGGTEISGGILAASAVEAQKPCAFSGPIPGMAAVVLDDQGNAVTQQVGELAITVPWPGMTRGFLHDRERYLDSYWRRFPGVWVHGDFAYIDADGFWYILGRSDDTMKLAGKRVGPAEIESILVSHPQVAEAAAIGVPHPVKGEALVCFVVLLDPKPPAEELMHLVESSMGKALKPSKIIVVEELPKTRNGKVVRRAIKARYLGQPLGDISAIENLVALESIHSETSKDR